MKIDPEILPITDKNEVELSTSFVSGNKTASLSVTSVAITEKENSENKIEVSQFKKPPEGLSPQFTKIWQAIAYEKAPYDKRAFFEKNGC